jgi:hypothetical protein
MIERERVALPRVLAVLESFHTSAEIYILHPLRALAQQGRIKFDARLESQTSPGRLAWADLVVYGRNVTVESHPLFEEVISRGIPSVYVLDDNFWDLPAELQLDEVYRKSHQIHQLERYVRYASRVKVFSPFLAEKVRSLNPAVLLDTPCIDFSLLPVSPPARDPHKVKITYATARGSRDPFLALFVDDLRALLQKYSEQVELHLFGEMLQPFADLPNVHCQPLNWDYPTFIHNLAESGFDIGLAPMNETPFNLSKTNTKLRDYGACRIAGVYSNVQNYADVQDGLTGLIVEQRPGAWIESLERLVLDARLRSDIQENAYRYVYDHYRQEITEAEWAQEIEELTAPRRSLLVNREKILNGRRLYFGNGELPAPAWRVSACWHPGVALVADLNQPLPFAPDSLDAICLYHQLEEVDDLQRSMAEVYRICRDGAAVSVVAAFARNDASAANPRQRQQITGQTPRYWTSAAQPAPYPPEVGLPEEVSNWGLNQDGWMDFRCVRVEYFHSEEFMRLSASERSSARNQRWNVCDTIFFNLLVVKPPCNSTGMTERMVSMENFEPVEITLRRLRELTATQVVDMDAHEAARQSAEQTMQAAWTSNEEVITQMKAERKSHQAETSVLQTNLNQSQAQTTRLEEEKQVLEDDLAKSEATEIALRAQLTIAQAALQVQKATAQAEMQAAQQIQQQQAAQYEQTIGEYQRIGRNVALQLDEQRRRFLYRLVSRLRDRTQLLPHVPAGLQQLVDDSFIFNSKLDGYLLQPGISLHAVPFVSYRLSPGRAGWRGVILAGVLDVPLIEGYLGVEVVSPQQQIVAQVTLPAIQVASYLPIRLEFPALADSASGEYELRVFGRSLDAPLRLLEWRKYRLGGLLSTNRKPFIGLIF